MFDDILDIFSLHDLFTPLTSFFMDLRGPHTHFGIASMAGKTKREVRQLLGRNGITVWGDMYDGDIFIFTVAEKDTENALKILKANRVAVVFPVGGIS